MLITVLQQHTAHCFGRIWINFDLRQETVDLLLHLVQLGDQEKIVLFEPEDVIQH